MDSKQNKAQSFKTASLRIDLNPNGEIISIHDIVNDKEYLAQGQSSPLLQVVIGNEIYPPEKAIYNPELRLLEIS